MSADLVKNSNKKYKLVAPDGGWGYMICVAFVIHCSCMSMFLGCFGMLFNDFMKEINMTSAGVTTLSGVQAASISIAGFSAAPLLKVASMRKLSMAAVIIALVGNVGMIFANNAILFILFQAIFPGISLGLIFNFVCSIMNQYFEKKRLFAFSIVQSCVATAAMVAPAFVKWSLDEYGFRGTLILIFGINFNTIFAVLLMQPVEWHMKKVEVRDESEMQILLVDEKGKAVAAVDITTDTKSGEKGVEENMNLEPVKTEKSAIMKLIYTLVDVKPMKSYILSCGCLGVAIATFVDGTYSLMFPQALYDNGWEQSDVAFALTLYNFGDLLMRVVLIFASNWLFKIGSQELYVVGLVLAIISRLGMLWSQNPIVIYVYIVLIGVARCFIIVLITIVVSDCVAPDKFTQAMGIYMVVGGSIIFFFGPVIGFIRDLTNSYATAFYVLTSLLAIVVLFWSIELCYKKNKEKRKKYAEKMAKLKCKT